MVEDTLVGNVVFKDPLTPAMIEAGEALMHKLDEMGVPISAAFWFFDVEIPDWRFMFASTESGLVVQRKIREAIDQLQIDREIIPRDSIRVYATHDDLIRRLRRALHTGDGLSRIRLRRDYADGRYIEDALVYRAA